MSVRVDTPEQAVKNEPYRAALAELLFQLADDDLLAGFRASEWLGLAPHIEADVAFSSIAQNTVGHAAMMYEMLQSLGENNADDLVHLRSDNEFRNAILVEHANGQGHYLHEPRFDWAFAVARYYVYEQAKAVKLEALSASSYRPLSELSVKIAREQLYHLIHWKAWVKQLAESTAEAHRKLTDAFTRIWPEIYELLSLGSHENNILAHGLIEGSAVLRERWLKRLKEDVTSYRLVTSWELYPGNELSGREGQHTGALSKALETLSSVYRQDPAASW